MFYLKSKQLETADPLGAPADGDWRAEFERLAVQAESACLRDYYEAGMVAAETPLEDAPLVAMDFETTGLDPQQDGIVSIGLVPMSLARIRCGQARHWVLQPREVLTEQSVVVHGITHTDIATAPDLSAILEPLLEQLAGRVVVVHHQAIERGFLDAALRVRIGEGIRFPVIDTLALEARLHRRQRWSLWHRIRGRQPVSLRLADSRSRYHLPFYQPHQALTDALACAELLQAQVTHHFSPATPIQALWC